MLSRAFGLGDSYHDSPSPDPETRRSRWGVVGRSDNPPLVARDHFVPPFMPTQPPIVRYRWTKLCIPNVCSYATIADKKYGPKRAEYIAAFWAVVNWEEVARRYAEATK